MKLRILLPGSGYRRRTRPPAARDARLGWGWVWNEVPELRYLRDDER